MEMEERCLKLLKGYFGVCSHLVESTIFPNDGYHDVYPMRDLNEKTHAFLIEIGEIDPVEEEEEKKELEKIGEGLRKLREALAENSDEVPVTGKDLQETFIV